MPLQPEASPSGDTRNDLRYSIVIDRMVLIRGVYIMDNRRIVHLQSATAIGVILPEPAHATGPVV